MKIRTALSLKYTLLTATIFSVCMLVILAVSEHTRSNTFFHDLRSEAITKAHLFLQNQVDASTMQSIYRNNRQFINEVEVAVYSSSHQLLYHDADSSDIIKEDGAMLKRIEDEHFIQFSIGTYQAIGLLYTFEGKPYLVTAAAYDGYGHNNLNELKNTLILLFLVGLSLLFMAGYLFAWLSLKPIRRIVHQMDTLSARHIDRRLKVQNHDELGELGTTFNALLDRLEQSFNTQKMFVSNVSHELRTPLAALTAELDIALQKERTAEQYRTILNNSLEDAHRMNRLIDGLLNLAKADYQKEQIKLEELRLDELLLDARQQLLRAHPDYRIELVFETETDDDRLITVRGSVYLLNIALSNLMDNNCKYSQNHSSFVQISYWKDSAIVRLSDNGTGMSQKDMEQLYTLFHRGENEKVAEGNGIGMVLTKKIIHLHQGSLHVYSDIGCGTTFVMELPHI